MRQQRILSSPNWEDGRFRNSLPTGLVRGQSGSVVWRFLFEGEEREPEAPLPVVARTGEELARAPADAVRVTWMGHSTVLLEIEGRRILFDPVWSERSSPSQLVGPHRFHPPPIALDDLPDPDLVVISHDHFDHLDQATLEALAPRVARFVTPLGVGAYLEEWGVRPDKVIELDWWERAEIGPSLAVVATPARHFSGRGLFGRNGTLWASWVVLGGSHRIFFGGDGGFFPGVAEIGARFGPFDLSMLEIGAYDPAWGDVHLGPQNAVRMHLLLRAKVLLPIHWGTFNLGLHAWYEPPEQLLVAARDAGVTLALPRIGESVVLGEPLPDAPWWREARRGDRAAVQ